MKKIISIILVIAVALSMSINVMAATAADEHEHEYGQVVSRDANFITLRDVDGNIIILDRTKEIKGSPLLRAGVGCGCNAGTYNSTFREHSQSSPTCYYTDYTYQYCNNCGAYREVSVRNGSHIYNSRTCV